MPAMSSSTPTRFDEPGYPPATITEFQGVRSLHLGTSWVQGAMRIAKPDNIELEYVQMMIIDWSIRYVSRQLSHKAVLECVDFVLFSAGHAAQRWSSLDGGLSQTSSSTRQARGGRFHRNGWRSRACA